MINFQNPIFLLFLLFLIPLIILIIKTNFSDLKIFKDKELEKKMMSGKNSLTLKNKLIIFGLSFFFLIIGISNPYIPNKPVSVDTNNIDMIIAFDSSPSMKEKDFYPNRFEFSKLKAKYLIKKLNSARIGAITFNSKTFLISPLTKDISTLNYLINNININNIHDIGTNFAIAIESSFNLFEEKNMENKILFLFTDGGKNKDFSKEIKLAKKFGISVYILNIGKNINDDISTLSLETNGAFIKSNINNKDIDLLIENLDNNFMNKENIIINKNINIYYIPLIIAFILFSFLFTSYKINFKRKRKINDF